MDVAGAEQEPVEGFELRQVKIRVAGGSALQGGGVLAVEVRRVGAGHENAGVVAAGAALVALLGVQGGDREVSKTQGDPARADAG